jgi:hypothetical protein
MTAVLGIDAAWTVSQPSGVALAHNRGDGWELVLVSPSYQDFVAGRGGWYGDRPLGSSAIARELLATAQSDAGVDVHVVAIDMPLSREPITSRRTSDNLMSSAYGARKCGSRAERPTPRRNQRSPEDRVRRRRISSANDIGAGTRADRSLSSSSSRGNRGRGRKTPMQACEGSVILAIGPPYRSACKAH